MPADTVGTTVDAAESATAATVPAPDRPAVKVNTVEPPAVPAPTQAASESTHRPRATVKVNPIPEALGDADASRHAVAPVGPTMGRPTDADVPELVLQTPVEMWFGDSRVGVKPGSATYERFRKYADVLFADLKQSQAQADNT